MLCGWEGNHAGLAESNGCLYHRVYAQSPPRCTKCNSPSINGQCTNFILFDVHYNSLCPLKV